MSEGGDKPLKTIFYSHNVLDGVTMIEFHDDRTDNIVYSRAETAAGNDGRLGFGRIEVDHPAGAGDFDGQRRLEVPRMRGKMTQIVVIDDAPVVGGEIADGYR